MSDQSRRDFMRNVVLLSCAASGCARRVSPVRSIGAAAPVDGNVVIPSATAPELQRQGGAVIVRPDGSLRSYLVANTGTGFLALDALCPHQGCELTWVPEDREAECPCHGSRFAGDGTVLQPPARTDLAHYPADAPSGQGTVVVHLFAGDGVFREPVRNGQFSFAVVDYPQLQTVGATLLGRPDGFPSPLLITRLASSGADAFVAVSAICSHLGCTVLPQRCASGPGCPTSGSLLQCPCHGSQFAVTGSFISGPAGSDLLHFPSAFDGQTLIIQTQPA